MNNWYSKIDKRLLPKRSELKGFDKHGLKSPYFLLSAGRSGLGKTNALMELLHRANGSYDNIILCCMSFASDPLYVSMKTKNKSSMDVYEAAVPKVSEYMGDKKKRVIIFDDMVAKKEFESAISDWFIRGRKAGADMIFITQSYFDVPTLIRRSLSNLYLFPSSNKRELSMILREYPFMSDKEDEIHKYKRLVKGDGPSSFLNINVQSGTACIDFDLYKN